MTTIELFVSRRAEGMSWNDLVRAWIPEASNAVCESLLWEGTCFPMGSVEQVERQIAEAASFPTVGDYLNDCYRKLDDAMRKARENHTDDD